MEDKKLDNGFVLFKRFLMDNNCYAEFIDNLTKFTLTTSQEMDAYLSLTSMEHYLFTAFEWSQTKQGKDFWLNIENKWSDLLKLAEENGSNK